MKTWTLYCYKVIRYYSGGTLGKRTQTWREFTPCYNIGGIYLHSGKFYRILSMEEKQFPEE